MKRDRSPSSPSVEELLEAGLILPDRPNLSLDWRNYQKHHEFWSKDLEARRMLCPDLFLVGSNVINDDSYFNLNRRMTQELQRQFPLVPFETRGDFRRFLETPTFYLVNWLADLEGEDILGNDYRSLGLSVVFLRICPGDPMGHYDVYSQEELIATFLQHNDFINLKWRPALFGPADPTHSKMMTPVEIARIEKLLRDLLSDYAEAEILLDVIAGVKRSLTHRLQIVEELRSVANEEMKGFFYALLYAGMRMRGWSGTGPYPLKSAETSSPVDDVALIDRLMSLLLSPKQWLELPLFNYVVPARPIGPAPLVAAPPELLEPAPEVDPVILEAPLEFDNQFERFLREIAEQERELDEFMPAGEFQISTDPQDGLTILERLLIILKNENDHACIRLSSGWFCSTAWYYLRLYFEIEPFRIDDLAWIS